MDENYFNLITAFVTAGGLGFINFYILDKLDIIKIKKNEKEDKALFILFFSIINYSMYLFFSSNIVLSKISKNELLLESAKSIIFTVCITVFLSMTIFPLLAKFLFKAINHVRVEWLKKSRVENANPRDLVFNSKVPLFVYIFDLDGKFVAEGYLKHWSTDADNLNQISLTAPNIPTNDTIEDVRKLFSSEDDESELKSPKLLMDLKNKYQYFIFDGS